VGRGAAFGSNQAVENREDSGFIAFCSAMAYQARRSLSDLPEKMAKGVMLQPAACPH
jgi:hypothetical protein